VEDQLAVLLKLLIAVALGAAVGYERAAYDKPAGLRTHALTALASALFVALALQSVEFFSTFQVADVSYGTDPLRVFQAIVVGVSFLGAGTILKQRSDETVRHLSTAASILATSAIGIAVGLEQYVLAVGAAIIVVIVNFAVGLLQGKEPNWGLSTGSSSDSE